MDHDPADTLFLNFWPPELCDNKFPLFQLFSLWYFVTATLGHLHSTLQNTASNQTTTFKARTIQKQANTHGIHWFDLQKLNVFGDPTAKIKTTETKY